MSESMVEHEIRLQAIERSVERSRLDILGRLTRVENSMSKAKEDQKQLLETLVGRFCDSLGQLEGLLATTEGKCSQLLFKLLDEFREGLSRQKNGPAVGSDSNDMAMSMAQQEQQLGLIQKAISSLMKEQKQHQQAVNKTITQTKSEQMQLLDTISESTDGNKERLRVLKQMLIVQRGALDRRMSNLPDVYKELLASDEGDVVIKLKDGKQLRVISYLIKNRSPVFKAMLDASMQESSTGVVDLSSQYSLEAFREFMAFLYYNKLHTGSYVPLLFEILCIADYFQVDAYKTYITGQIIALIQNVPICLIIASETQKHGLLADTIYTRCLGFLTYALGGCYDVYCGDSKPWCFKEGRRKHH
ncbi:hypothetical protein BGZ72_007029 [Mortierella alpina]|nr:hypothetical protein BGZ72_007029 [Mortierella alpina]